MTTLLFNILIPSKSEFSNRAGCMFQNDLPEVLYQLTRLVCMCVHIHFAAIITIMTHDLFACDLIATVDQIPHSSCGFDSCQSQIIFSLPLVVYHFLTRANTHQEINGLTCNFREFIP